MAAKDWANVGPQIKYSASPIFPEVSIPYTTASILGYIGAVEIGADQTRITSLEHVQVTVSLTSSFRGGLVFELTCPSGTGSVLLTARPHDSVSGALSWTFMTTRCWDESPIGTWHLFVHAVNPTTNGHLKAWSITIYGTDKSASLKTCQVGEYVDIHDNCSPCDVECGDDGCVGHGPALCNSCRNFILGNTCHQECPEKFYKSGTALNRCEPCHGDCETCVGPGPSQCKSCVHYSVKNDSGLTCVTNCETLHYVGDGKVCLKCHELCSVGCTGPGANQCFACRGYISSGYCVDKCSNMTYPRNGLCNPCDSKCAVGCHGPGTHACIECVGLQVFYSSNSSYDCIDSCPPNTEYDKARLACAPIVGSVQVKALATLEQSGGSGYADISSDKSPPKYILATLPPPIFIAGFMKSKLCVRIIIYLPLQCSWDDGAVGVSHTAPRRTQGFTI